MPEIVPTMTFHAGGINTSTGEETSSTSYVVTDFIYKPYDAIVKLTIDETIDRGNIAFFVYTPKKEFIGYKISSGFDVFYKKAVYFKIRYTSNDPSSITNKIKASIIQQTVLDCNSKNKFNASVLSMPLTANNARQMFNKYDYIDERYFLWGFDGSDSAALSRNENTVMFAIDLNGIIDSDHLVYSYNLLDTTVGVSQIGLYAANKFPFTIDDIGNTVLYGSLSANLANRRGRLTLSATTYKYLVFKIKFSDIASDTPYVNTFYNAVTEWSKVADKLVVRCAYDYDTTYYNYYTYQIESEIASTIAGTVPGMISNAIIEDAIPKNMGTANANKMLVVDASGYVTTGETTESNIGENDVRYMPTRTLYVGSNLITESTVASGTGWSGDFENGFTHASGNTDPLIVEVSTTADEAYIIDFDTSSTLESALFVAIGNSPQVDVYHGTVRPFVGIVSDGGYLKIYPKSSYTGTITNLKIRPVQQNGTELVQNCYEVTHGENENELSGWNIVAIGRHALYKNVNGTRTIAIGDGALEKMVTGHRNIAIGTYAMPFVTEGDCNISIGADTLYNPSMSTGESKAYSNIAIGKGTMRNGTLVQNNIALGQGAMSENDLNAQENVCIGRQAGYNTKSNNTFIGYRAGYYFNGDAGINNVCIGHDAGFNAYHNGQNNVYIGAEAKANVSGASASTPKTVNNSIAIGKGAKVDASYQIVIGNANYTTVKIAGKTLVFNNDGTVTWT